MMLCVAMSEEREYVICTSKDGSVCIGCELYNKLNCRYDENLVRCFRNRHRPYGVLGFIIVGVASYLTALWWGFLLFAVVTILNFAAIETWYLCKHCPFYEKESKTLECITLKGLPRFWRFDLGPMKRSDKIAMSVVGGFIDLFPTLIGAYATWVLFSTGADILLTILMLGLTVISIGAAAYLERFIGENYCKRCVNLSCMMNKVPDELKEEYLRKNPEMLKAWEACGYVFGNESIEK